jgi:hypothetical protein
MPCEARGGELNGRRYKPPPIYAAGSRILRGLASLYGFEGLLPANIHFDLRGLGFGLLGEADIQNALVTTGTYLPLIHGTGKGERAGKASVLPLDATEVLLFLFLLDLALTMDGEGAGNLRIVDYSAT